MNIFFQVEANPVQMRCQGFCSAVMANSKLDYCLMNYIAIYVQLLVEISVNDQKTI